MVSKDSIVKIQRVFLLVSCILAVSCQRTRIIKSVIEPKITYKTKSPGVSYYGLRQPEKLLGLKSRIYDVLRESRRKTSVSPIREDKVGLFVDRAANKVAQEICVQLPPNGPPPPALVDFIMRQKKITPIQLLELQQIVQC